MNLQVANLGEMGFEPAILFNRTMGGSYESEVIQRRSEEALDHFLLSQYLQHRVYEQTNPMRVSPELTKEGELLTLGEVAKILFPKFHELSSEEAKEHNQALISFFD